MLVKVIEKKEVVIVRDIKVKKKNIQIVILKFMELLKSWKNRTETSKLFIYFLFQV